MSKINVLVKVVLASAASSIASSGGRADSHAFLPAVVCAYCLENVATEGVQSGLKVLGTGMDVKVLIERSCQ